MAPVAFAPIPAAIDNCLTRDNFEATCHESATEVLRRISRKISNRFVVNFHGNSIWIVGVIGFRNKNRINQYVASSVFASSSGIASISSW
jgi:hypothetical protein